MNNKYILVNPVALRACLAEGQQAEMAVMFSAIPANEHAIASMTAEISELKDRLAAYEGEGMIPMPTELTAENGAKAALMGEFSVEVEVENPEYCGCGDCDYCIGPGIDEPETVIDKHMISWTTIKEIYKKTVELFNG